MRKDWNMKSYRLTFTNYLSDVDINRRRDACHALLKVNPLSHPTRSVTDERAIYRSIRDINFVFWASENLNFTVEFEHQRAHVML